MTYKHRINVKDSSSDFRLREGRKDDDKNICTLMRSISMRGYISLTTDYSPSFFNAIEVEGSAHRVMVAESNDQILGICLFSKRKMFLNNVPTNVGYASNLRIDASIRGKAIIDQACHLWKQWDDEYFKVPFYLCAMLKDNLVARKFLASGRTGLLKSKDIGTLYNASILLLKRRLLRPPDGLQIVRGSAVGAVKIAEFLNRTGSKKQFFPVYTAEDIMTEEGILRGLRLDDFRVAVKGDQIVGTIACWNQIPFRRMMVTGFSGYMRLLKPCIAALAKLFHMAAVPNIGEPFRNVHAACIVIADDNQQIFNLLLNHILHEEYNTGKTFLVASLMEGDPLLPVLQKYLHIPIRTCIYAMGWDGLNTLKQLDGRMPYLEIGGL